MEKNPTLELIEERASTRKFVQEPLTQDEKDAIVHAAFRAPTACNMMMYSMVEIADKELIAKLAVSCDNQPFIKTAPFILLFVADYQKWVDLYDFTEAHKLDTKRHHPGEAELALGICDALIAAQNTVIAAESLGIGSCYIGDILENGEQVAEWLQLPRYTLPITMVVYGKSPRKIATRSRQDKYVLMKDAYHRLDKAELAEVSDHLDALFAPHGFTPPVENYAQDTFKTKYASDFMEEMSRSVRWWIDRWCGEQI